MRTHGHGLTILFPLYAGRYANPFGEVRQISETKCRRMLEPLKAEACDVLVVADGCEGAVRIATDIGVRVALLRRSPNTTDEDGVRRRHDYGNAALNYGLDVLGLEANAATWIGYGSCDDWTDRGFYTDVSRTLAMLSRETAWAWTDTGRKDSPSKVNGISGVDIYHRLSCDVRWRNPQDGIGIPDGKAWGGYGHDHDFASRMLARYGAPTRIPMRDGYKVGHVPGVRDE